MLTICSLLKDNNANFVFEIGTFDGRTTRSMAMNLRDHSGKVHTLNLPEHTQAVSLTTSMVDVNLASKVISGERFLQTAQNTFVEQLWGDSAKFDFTAYENKVDFVFIDGAHSKEYADNDTQVALRMMKQTGGLIVWHDAHLYGVVQFLKNWIRKNNYPVYFIKGTSIAVMAVKNGKPYDFRQAPL